MRSAFVVAAFAAGALAVPLMEREVVWETDVVYATQYVTVTAGDVAPTAAPPAYPTSSEHWGHRKKKTSSSSKSKTRSKPKPTSSSAADSSNNSPKAYSSSEASSQDSPKATSSSSEVQEAAKETAWAYSWSTTWSESAPTSTSVEEQAPAYTSEKSEPAPTSYDAPKSYSETPTSTKAASSSDAKPTGYQGMVLHHHNIHRDNHSAPALTWSDSLAATAQKIGETCIYAHNMEMDIDQGAYGQNIAAGVEANNVSAVITELFYNGEVSFYDDLYAPDPTDPHAKDPDTTNFHEWGHFSQMVWVNTTEVGCATVDCSSQGLANTGGNVAAHFTVCNYKAQGNMGGEYAANILKPRGDPTCYWNDGM